MLTDNNYVV